MKKRDNTYIDYKDPSEKRYKKYIGIGGYDWEAFYFVPNECKIPSSLSAFREECLSKDVSTDSIETIRRLLYEYKEDTENFKEEYEQELISIIENNMKSIHKFFVKWYQPDDYMFFKGLDFVYFGEEDLLEKFENRDGFITMVICKNGAIIRNIPPDHDWQQYFVLESDYDELNNDYQKLIGYFNKFPFQ